MTRIVLDSETRSKLGNLGEAIEFTDEKGLVLGHFRPLLADEGWEPQISEEEIQRRLRQGGGRTLAEILADLQRQA